MQTLRDEIGALFGIRWTSFVEWSVIAWLSLWFWAATSEGHAWSWNRIGYLSSNEDGYGPISGILVFLEATNLNSPDWLSEFLNWLHHSENNWIYISAVMIAVTASVTAARSYTYAGLRVLALLTAAIACEVTGELRAVFVIVALAAIPAAIGCVIGWLDDHGFASTDPEGPHFYWPEISSRFLTQILFLFLQPPFAPIFLALSLLFTFQIRTRFVPSKEINRIVVRTLEAHGQKDPSKVDALTQAASSAAISLAGNDSGEAREILNAYYFALERQEKGSRSR